MAEQQQNSGPATYYGDDHVPDGSRHESEPDYAGSMGDIDIDIDIDIDNDELGLGSLLPQSPTQTNYQPLRDLTKEDFLTGRCRRFGITNPEVQDIPFCNAMILTSSDPWTAYKVLEKTIGDEETENYMPNFEMGDTYPDPTWTFDMRMGDTETRLPDGRVVHIGGEHEDFYDVDFCIYNDVVVEEPSEDLEFKLYGYPRDVFPPTDFHTATVVGEDIWIIGRLGYDSDGRGDLENGRCHDTTPVYRLDTRDFSMHKVETSGECPAWIHEHEARAVSDHEIEITNGKVYAPKEGEGKQERDVCDNAATWILDVRTGEWRKL